MRISFRHADLLDTLQETTTPPVDVDFIIIFPTANMGNEHAKKGDKYYGITELSIKGTANNPIENRVIDRVEKAMGDGISNYNWEDLYSFKDETFDDFTKRILRESKAKLATISDTPPTHSMQSTGRYQWIIHLKIKPIKK